MIVCHSKSGKSLFVMGLGLSGLATVKALVAGGATVIAWDDREDRRADAARLGARMENPDQARWTGIDALVLSPGIPHTHPAPHPAAAYARAAGVPIIGDVELLLANARTQNHCHNRNERQVHHHGADWPYFQQCGQARGSRRQSWHSGFVFRAADADGTTFLSSAPISSS